MFAIEYAIRMKDRITRTMRSSKTRSD